jgi:hypothetical protein
MINAIVEKKMLRFDKIYFCSCYLCESDKMYFFSCYLFESEGLI